MHKPNVPCDQSVDDQQVTEGKSDHATPELEHITDVLFGCLEKLFKDYKENCPYPMEDFGGVVKNPDGWVRLTLPESDGGSLVTIRIQPLGTVQEPKFNAHLQHSGPRGTNQSIMGGISGYDSPGVTTQKQ